ncbi:unnamed protein product, partial [Prunus brigantina]
QIAVRIKREKHALLQFKQGLMDESNVLATWGDKRLLRVETNHMQQPNRQCHRTKSLLRRGWYAPLRGEIGPSLLELEYLDYLDISNNDFRGMVIPNFTGSLSQLKATQTCKCKF